MLDWGYLGVCMRVRKLLAMSLLHHPPLWTAEKRCNLFMKGGLRSAQKYSQYPSIRRCIALRRPTVGFPDWMQRLRRKALPTLIWWASIGNLS